MSLNEEIDENVKNTPLSSFHMENKLDFVKSQMTFNPEYEIKHKNFVFRKPLFIVCSIVSCLLLVGSSIGITVGVVNGNDHSENNNIINQSYTEAKQEFGNDLKLPNYVFVLNEMSIINSYNEKNGYYIQLYSTDCSNIKANFTNNNQTKIMTLNKQKNKIEQLNTADFTIKKGDVVNADVYINDVFNKKITLNF